MLFISAFVFVSTKTLCPVNWAEFKGECLYFAHDSRSWVDAQVNRLCTIFFTIHYLFIEEIFL
jgi:hypothetical protein